MNNKELLKDTQQHELYNLLREMPLGDIAETMKKALVREKEDRSALDILLKELRKETK